MVFPISNFHAFLKPQAHSLLINACCTRDEFKPVGRYFAGFMFSQLKLGTFWLTFKHFIVTMHCKNYATVSDMCLISDTRVVFLIGPKIQNLELHKPCGAQL